MTTPRSGSDNLASSAPAAIAETTGSRTTRIIGGAALIGMAVLLWLAFERTPADLRQKDAVRLLYVHFPTVLVAYTAFIITTVGSIAYLWKRSRWWDLAAHASAEIGMLFLALTLITGTIWGRPTWGTWWQWGDARVMTTLMLFLMYVGYIALRGAIGDPEVRAKRAAIVGIVASLNIPIVNRSVVWWENRTLHQQSSIGDVSLDTFELKYEDATLFALFFGFVVFGLIFAWLLIHRFRVGWLEYQIDEVGLAEALVERRSEAAADVEAAVTVRSEVSR